MRWVRKLFLGLLVVGVLAAAWHGRAPLLTALARAWVIEDRLEKADAIVVLGGGESYRPFHAARLYRQGWAPLILIMDITLSPTDELGITPSQRAVTERVLLRHGVPPEVIMAVGQRVGSTYDEALALRDWSAAHHPRKLIVVTELFHTRRCDWLFRKILAQGAQPEAHRTACSPGGPARESHPIENRKSSTGNSPEFLFAPCPHGTYAVTNWWRDEQGLLNFQNEILKYLYYRWRY